MSESPEYRPTALAAAFALIPSGLVAAEASAMTLDEVARGYLELALAIGEHDPNHVDAYYGPEQPRAKVQAEKADLATAAWRERYMLESSERAQQGGASQTPTAATSSTTPSAGAWCARTSRHAPQRRAASRRPWRSESGERSSN